MNVSLGFVSAKRKPFGWVRKKGKQNKVNKIY